ncbi:MAG: DegV family protein [Lachnospiraceae bacterium]|nr:DegV family protein [Lachnospiraceae bacterium]
MPRVAVMTDSNSGITQDMAKDMGINVVPMPFTIDGTTYYEDVNLTREEFFQMMADGKDIQTSQPSPGDLMSLWDKSLEKYDQIVYIPMSSGLSSSCQNARMIANDYNGKVVVVNNQRISVTQKRSVQDAIELAKNGYDAVRIRDILVRDKFEASIYIMLDTLKYLKKGGRITPAAAAVGTLMRIKPVLQIKGERLDAFSKARTLAQGKSTMINAIHHDIDNLFGGIDAENVYMYAVHAQIPEPFAVFKKEVADAFPKYKVEEDRLSLSICCHIGPGALAMGCVKKCSELN